MPRRSLALVVTAAALALAACSADSPGAATTSSAAVTTVTDATTSSTDSPSTTSTEPATTTTHLLVLGLELSSEGLGARLFGDDGEAMIAYVAAILGAADEDSGWLSTQAEGLACPGTEVRFVRWHDLTLTFSDESPYASGSRHFAAYTYGPAAGAEIEPWGLQTIDGLGVGSTVEDLQGLYPEAVVHPSDELSGPSFYIEEGLRGFLTGTEPTDQVISFVGGYGCGE